MAHFLADSEAQVLGIRVLADRQRWLGRNRDASQPLAGFGPPVPLLGEPQTLDTGLDPVCAIAVRLRIAPLAKARLTFATAASEHDGTLSAVIDKYRQPSHVQRASLMSATLAGIRLRTLRVNAETFAAIQTLSTALVLSLTRPDARRRARRRHRPRGHRPAHCCGASASRATGRCCWWRPARCTTWGCCARWRRGCGCGPGAASPATWWWSTRSRVLPAGAAARTAGAARAPCRRKRGAAGVVATALHVLRSDELSALELATLRGLARVQLQADGRSLLHHVQAWAAAHELALELRRDIATTALAERPAADAAVAPAQGEFAAESGEFRFDAGAARRPARPWINVLSNPGFGAQLSEAGGGYTWALNSRLNQLTAWSNDAVSDPASESFLIQDRRSQALWQVAAGERCGLSGADGSYRVAHGQGYSVISHRRDSLQVDVSLVRRPAQRGQAGAAAPGQPRPPHAAPARGRHRRMDDGREPRRPRHGAHRAATASACRRHSRAATAGSRERRLTALLCTQRERAAGFGEGTAFFALAGDADDAEDWSCDRREFFDARGRLVLPDHLGRQQGGGLDPCAALATRRHAVGRRDRRTRVPARLCRQPGRGAPAGHHGRRRAGGAAAGAGAPRTGTGCSARPPCVTPDPLFDALVNRWLLYQVVSCRLWAKAGFYQAGGATGFRDQLQDAMALAWAEPALLRAQILLAASRQFAEGDVQHWWHAPGGAGVRTHFSDDLLWLAFALTHYLRATGDAALLDETVPFLEGAAVPDGAEDAYYTPTPSAQQATVYEHAARAIDRSLRVGAHGLPLMGSGDWNDGMNRVGIEGRGESVWLGWFLCTIVADFAPRARSRGETRARTALGTGRARLDGRAERRGLGRAMVQARLLRRRPAAGVAAPTPKAAST